MGAFLLRSCYRAIAYQKSDEQADSDGHSHIVVIKEGLKTRNLDRDDASGVVDKQNKPPATNGAQ
ncbi:hypothetical protein OK016_08345 [Vibrio chagasii]|nr:hypothetical protein [Vibrio chagasii]